MDTLTELFTKYFKDIPKLRKELYEMDNFSFNSKYALRFSGTDYPVRDCLFRALCDTTFKKVMIFYKDTPCFKSVNDLFQTLGCDFPEVILSYYEYSSAISASVSDVRHRQAIDNNIEGADCVIVLNTRDCYDVVLNQIKNHSNNVLVMVE